MPMGYEFYTPGELAAGMKGDASDQKKNFPPVTRPARNIVDAKENGQMNAEHGGYGKVHSGSVSMRPTGKIKY